MSGRWASGWLQEIWPSFVQRFTDCGHSEWLVILDGRAADLGFKFLHEIWTRTSPGVNALPGFADTEAQGEVFTTIAHNHWSLFGNLIETLILPVMGLWVVVFAVVQLAVGASLVVGYRTRLMGIIGLVYLGVLIALGMTRYAPFLFGLMIPVVALDGGRLLSLDRVQQHPRNQPQQPSQPDLPGMKPALTAQTDGTRAGEQAGGPGNALPNSPPPRPPPRPSFRSK